MRSEINFSRFRYQYTFEDSDTFLQYAIDEVRLFEISPTSKLRAKSLEVKKAKRYFVIGIATHTVNVAGNY